MPLLQPYIQTAREIHGDQLWRCRQAQEYYVRKRRQHCSYQELMDLWLRAPFCTSCMESDPFYRGRPPDVSVGAWEEEVEWQLGESRVIEIRNRLAENPDYSIICKKCGAGLRPWDGDDLYVVRYHLEEDFEIPLETPGKRRPSKETKRLILALYGRRCFNCGRGGELHLDHVRPRSRGGDSAFRNLQPLCRLCGATKGDREPDEVVVIDDMHFDEPPSDGYEGLFW